MPRGSRNLRTRHLQLGAARLPLLRTHYLRRDRAVCACAPGHRAKRSSPIARFATSPTWSFNHPFLNFCRAPSLSRQGY